MTDVFMFTVFIVYGITFLVMAATLWLGTMRSAGLGIVGQMPILALFALIHGISDLVDALLRTTYVDASPVAATAAVRLVLLGTSFLFLLGFGIVTLIEDRMLRRTVLALGMLAVVGMAAGLAALFAQGADSATIASVERSIRLLLGLPGGLLSAYSLWRVQRRCLSLGLRDCGTGALVATLGMVAYAIMAGAFATGYPTALMILGLPVQLHRMATAIVLTIGCVMMIRSLRPEAVAA